MRLRLFDTMMGRRYDPVTGVELTSDAEERQAAIEAQIIEESNEIAQLGINKGWLRIKSYMEADVEKVYASLVDIRDINKLIEAQEFIKARRSLISWIDGKISEGQRLLEEQKQAQG